MLPLQQQLVNSWHKKVTGYFKEKQLVAQVTKETKKDLNLAIVIVSCITFGNDHLILGDEGGALHFFKSDLTIDHEKSFQGHNDKLLFCAYAAQKNHLVTLALEVDTGKYAIRDWDLSVPYQKDGEDHYPLCQEEYLRPYDEKRKPIPTVLAISSDARQIAVGLADGFVNLFSGDWHNKRVSKIIPIDPGTPITGLAYLPVKEGTDHLTLFAVTATTVKSLKMELSKNFDIKFSQENEKELDTKGGDISSSSL